ncbi:ribosome biogenesis protein Bms1 [Hamiltosporidium magnivora]|uniref:Ribosome biogenesis protein Bms1 n=1 Tax=Hamiltosporidium magnivora TaxID=148818 RepID=A0A4V2JW10_9MICR|nr:ribosome biogenesis protein Bms1 [Hamiltosporidium magnivora]
MNPQPPLPNMHFKDFPPPVVTIFGPPKSGKTTLFNSLLKRYSIKTANSPVTFTTSNSRFTFLECPSDIKSYIDYSKISDLCLLVINITSLETDTFEILSLLKIHGFPKIYIIFTHGDQLSSSNQRKQEKKIKKRLYQEITPGIKTFPMKHNVHKSISKYTNLSKLVLSLSSFKPRPLAFKSEHPFIIVDQCVSSNTFYGYLHGTMLTHSYAHIPGFGNLEIENVEVMEDPCPLNRSKMGKNKRYVHPSPVESVSEEKEENIVVEIPKTESETINLFGNMEIEIPNNSEDDSSSELPEDSSEVNVNEEEESLQDSSTTSEDISLRFKKNNLEEESISSEEVENPKYDDLFGKEKAKSDLQHEKNISKFSSLKSVVPGNYIKISFSNSINEIPIFIGFYNLNSKTLVMGKIKLNRHHKILKSMKPLLISVGWERTIIKPYFSMSEEKRNRYIKYTPKGIFCSLNYKGYSVTPGSGICLIADENKKDFRISASGIVTDIGNNNTLVKKLKLIGYPHKIHNNTVFMKGMFNSGKEVCKFINGIIKTVSGIRGQIKKNVGDEGLCRCTFEGQLVMSDIIFMRCYIPVIIDEEFVNDNDKIYEKNNFEAEKNKLGNLDENKDYMGEDIDVKMGKYRNEDCKNFRGKKIPKSLESKLPLNKRNIKVCDGNFELPKFLDDDFVEKERERQMILETKKKILEEKIKIKQDKRTEELKRVALKKKIVTNILERTKKRKRRMK